MEAGNDVSALVAAFEEVRDMICGVVVHIHTLKGWGCDGEEIQIGKTASASPVSFDSPTGVHPTDNVNHSEPWHSDHCNLSDHEPHEGQCEASHWQNPDAAIGKAGRSAQALQQNGDGRARTAFRRRSQDSWSSPRHAGLERHHRGFESARAHIM